MNATIMRFPLFVPLIGTFIVEPVTSSHRSVSQRGFLETWSPEEPEPEPGKETFCYRAQKYKNVTVFARTTVTK